MIIKSVKLFKVTFDNSYNNVFDFNHIADTTKFDEFLTFNFPNISIISDGNYSIKSINHNLSVTIKAYYETILDYNYCLLVTNEGNKFYFITDVVSENDNEANASCSINLDFDVWHNYLQILQDSSKFDENYVVKCHQNRFITKSNGDLQRIYSGTREDFEDNFSHIIGDGEYPMGKKTVLWLCVMFDNQTYFSTNDTEPTAERNYGMIPLLSNNPVCYVPVLAFDKNTHTPLDSIKYKQERDGVMTEISVRSAKEIFLTLAGTHVLDAFLTYYVPFYYEYDHPQLSSIGYVTLQPLIRTEGYVTSGVEVSHIYGSETIDIDTPVEAWGPFVVNEHKDPYYGYIRDHFSLKGYGDYEIEKDSEEYNIIKSATGKFNQISESKFYTHPYNYNTYKIRNEEGVIDNLNSVHGIGLYVDCTEKMSPTVKEIRFGTENKMQKTIRPQSKCTTQADAYEIFMRNSGESAYTNLGLGIIGKVISGMAGNYVASYRNIGELGQHAPGLLASVSSIGDVIKFNAKMKDIHNQQGMYNIPDFIAQNDMYYQDNVFVYKNEMYIDEEIDFVLFNFMRYGYALYKNKSLREQNRVWFDYIRTEHCSLPFISNINDRKLIESIYNKGVTKWHIHNVNNELYAMDNFDFTLNNPEIYISSIPEKLNTPQTPIIEGGVMYIQNVPFATQYLIIDYDTGEIYYRGQSTEITIGNLLPIEEREFKLVVQARADGFLPSDYSGIAIFNTSFTITYYISGLIANEDNPTSCSAITQTTLQFTANASKVFPKDLKVCGAIIRSWDYENGILILENATSNVNVYITALPFGNYGTATFNYMYDGYLAVFVSYVNRDNTFTFANPTSTTFSVEENKCYDTEGSLTITQNSASGSNWILKNNFNNHYGWSNIKLKDNTTNKTAKDSWYYVFTSATAITDASYIPYNPYMPNYEYLLTITANNIDGLETNPVTVSSKNTTTFKFVPTEGYKLPENIIVTGVDIVSWNSVSGILTLRLPTKSVNIQITGVAI